MKLIAAGFLIKSHGKYLLGHVTQNESYVYNPTDRLWTIPKGVLNEGETLLECAIRETREETGLDVSQFFPMCGISALDPNFTISTKYKTNHIFLLNDVDGVLYSHEFKCNSLIENKRLPHMNGKPEIDMFMWASREQASQLVHESIRTLFTEQLTD